MLSDKERERITILAFTEVVLPYEGGVAQVPGESWVTYYGQTPAWLRSFGLPQPENHEQAIMNYVAWADRVRLSVLARSDTDHLYPTLLDFAVHSGHKLAVSTLQGLIGVVEDGIIGPKTYDRIEFVTDGSPFGRNSLATLLLVARYKFLAGLIAKHPTKYARYTKGWQRRVFEQIENIAKEGIYA